MSRSRHYPHGRRGFWSIAVIAPPATPDGAPRLIFHAQCEDQVEVRALATEARSHNRRLQIHITDPFGARSTWD